MAGQHGINFRQHRFGVGGQAVVSVCGHPAHSEYQRFDFRFVEHQRRQPQIGMQYEAQPGLAAYVGALRA